MYICTSTHIYIYTYTYINICVIQLGILTRAVLSGITTRTHVRTLATKSYEKVELRTFPNKGVRKHTCSIFERTQKNKGARFFRQSWKEDGYAYPFSLSSQRKGTRTNFHTRQNKKGTRTHFHAHHNKRVRVSMLTQHTSTTRVRVPIVPRSRGKKGHVHPC